MRIKILTKPLIVSFSILLIFAVTGCNSSSDNKSGNTSKYGNLDLSNTKLTENIPESGQWKKMIFDYHSVNADTFNILYSAAKAYGKDSIDEDKVVCNIFTQGDNNPPEDINYLDITPDMYDDAAFMRYVGDDIYIDTTIHGKIELYNCQNVNDILGIEYDRPWSWRPSYNGTIIKKIDLQNDSPITDEYKLNGKNVAVDTALQYADSYINSGKLSPICSPEYKYKPLFVEIYQFDDDKYGYYFSFSLSYDGVPLDSCSGTSNESVPIANTIKVLMLTDNTVDWLWTCPMNQDVPASQEIVDIKIDYDTACQAVSETLSNEHVFSVDKVDLIYCTTELTDENTRWIYTGIEAEPMWQFFISDAGVQEYSSIFVNISAIDGKVYLRYE